MKRKLTLSAALLLLLFPVSLLAQNYVETDSYLSRARDNSTLFRSREATRYNLPFLGTYYWYDSEFLEGGVMFDGKWYDGVLLNIDAFSQCLLAKPDASRIPVIVPRDRVDYAIIDDIRFDNLRKQGYDVPDGYYEVVHTDPVIYRYIKKLMTTDMSMSGGGGKIYDEFDDHESFFCVKDGSLVKMKKSKAYNFILSSNPKLKLSGKSVAQAISPSKEAAPEVVVAELPDSLKPASSRADRPEEDFKIADKTIYATLPPEYFSTGQNAGNDELLRLINAGNDMVTFANKVYEIGTPGEVKGDRAVVRGTVRDVLSGEPLAGIAVYDGNTGAYAMTDTYGTYQMRLPIGENTLGFSGYSLEDLNLNVMVNGDGGLDVVMKEKVMSLKGAVVSAESMVNHRDARMGIEKVRINTITKVPSAFGEADVLKAVLTLPGVKSVGEASGRLAGRFGLVLDSGGQ